MARPKAFDETTALDSAAQLFWSRGYDGTSITDLEDGMGMGRQSIYNAFGDKRSLFLRALSHYSEWNREWLAATLLAPDAGLETIRTYFEQMLDFLTPEGIPRGCLVANSILEVGQEDEGIAAACRSNQDRVLRGFEQALRNAVRTGELPGEVDVSALAGMLMSHTYGLTVLAKSGVPRDELEAAGRALVDRLG